MYLFADLKAKKCAFYAPSEMYAILFILISMYLICGTFMPRDGSKTKQKILDAAYALLLENGLQGSSIERIVEHARITKGSFFYHFSDKDALLLALVERFALADRNHFFETLERVDRMSGDDPLERLLLFISLFIDQFSSLSDTYPGCLYASYLYQQGAITPKALVVIRKAILFWRTQISTLVDATRQKYPPVRNVDTESLADLFTTIIEGAFIVSKTLEEKLLIADQLKHYRSYIELLFRSNQYRPNLA